MDWIECDFTPSLPNVRITSIKAHPQRRSQSFLVLGTRSDTGVGISIHVDFSNLHEKQCTEDDYEQWTPYDNKHASEWRCILGETITYTRRKQNSSCFNGMDFEPSTAPLQCPCSYDDYECDVCFTRVGIHCSLINACDVNLKEPENCVDYYNLTKG